MKRKAKSVRAGTGAPCPKCANPMERMKHPDGFRPKADAPYYFAWWDRCRPCMHLQHYDEAKRSTKPGPKPGMKQSTNAKPALPSDDAHVEVWRAAARQAVRWRLGGCGKRYINQWIAQAMDIEPWHVDLDTMDRAELITVFDVCMKEKAPAA